MLEFYGSTQRDHHSTRSGLRRGFGCSRGAPGRSASLLADEAIASYLDEGALQFEAGMEVELLLVLLQGQQRSEPVIRF